MPGKTRLCKLLHNHELLCCYRILSICAGDWEVWEEGEQGSDVSCGYDCPHPNNVQAINDTHTQRLSLLGWLRGERARPTDQTRLDLDPALLPTSKV